MAGNELTLSCTADFAHLREGLLQGEAPPIDFHEIIALIAPRAFLDVSGLNDGDPLTQRQRLLMLAKLMELYELTGVPEKISFYVHGQGHSVNHESRELIYGWLDVHLKPEAATFSPLLDEGTKQPLRAALLPPAGSNFARRKAADALGPRHADPADLLRRKLPGLP